jgi:ferredoxin-NADP reductase
MNAIHDSLLQKVSKLSPDEMVNFFLSSLESPRYHAFDDKLAHLKNKISPMKLVVEHLHRSKNQETIRKMATALEQYMDKNGTNGPSGFNAWCAFNGLRQLMGDGQEVTQLVASEDDL